LHEIGRAFGKDHSSVQFLLSQHNSIGFGSPSPDRTDRSRQGGITGLKGRIRHILNWWLSALRDTEWKPLLVGHDGAEVCWTVIDPV